MDTLRMQCHHPRIDTRAAEEASAVVEKHFVVVHITVIERHPQSLWVAL